MSSLRHHLDARDHQRRDRALRLQHFTQDAIDAKAHHQAVLEGLDVDVRGALAHRLRQHGVDQADDRRVIVALEQIGLLGQFLHQVREIGVALEALDRLHRFVAGFVGPAQQLVEFLGRHCRELEGHLQMAARLGHGSGRDRWAIQAFRAAIHIGAHQQAMAAREREGQAERRALVAVRALARRFVQGVFPVSAAGAGALASGCAFASAGAAAGLVVALPAGAAAGGAGALGGG